MMVSIVIPTYNEKENVSDGYERVKRIMEGMPGYEYEILFIDNCSADGTRDILRMLAAGDSHVKVILNAVNVGWSRSSYYGMLQTNGDAVVLLSADMQEPPELIPEFVKEWEAGNRIVIGIKSRSRENPVKYFVRKFYYKLLKKIAMVDHIEQFMGFGLYDRGFIEILEKLDDPMPYLRGMVAELGAKRKEIRYTQDVRKKGRTHFSFMGMYDLAMLGITCYSKDLLRICTFVGIGTGCVSMVVAVTTALLKILHVIDYPVGIAAIIVAIFMLGAAILFFLGLMGEYILNINVRIMHRPLVIEEERINL